MSTLVFLHVVVQAQNVTLLEGILHRAIVQVLGAMVCCDFDVTSLCAQFAGVALCRSCWRNCVEASRQPSSLFLVIFHVYHSSTSVLHVRFSTLGFQRTVAVHLGLFVGQATFWPILHGKMVMRIAGCISTGGLQNRGETERVSNSDCLWHVKVDGRDHRLNKEAHRMPRQKRENALVVKAAEGNC